MARALTIKPDDLLKQLATPWIDMGGGRRALAKRNRPAQSLDPSPNIAVCAYPSEMHGDVVRLSYMQSFDRLYENLRHVPIPWAWQIIVPTRERLLLFTWNNWKQNSKSLFQKYLLGLGRQFTTIAADGSIELGARRFMIQKCKIVHCSHIQQQTATIVRPEAMDDDVAAAISMMQGTISLRDDIHIQHFDEADAHNLKLLEQTKARFQRRLQRQVTQLEKEFGEPAERGTDQHPDIPVNGVFRYALWREGGKTLYVAASHEDIGLPCVLTLGVSVPPAPQAH